MAPELDLSTIPRGPPGPSSNAPSVATTALASQIGSIVGGSTDGFLRSFTFFKGEPDMEWELTLADPGQETNGINGSTSFLRMRGRRKIFVDRVGGTASLSQIREGDTLERINGKKIGPSFTARGATDLMTRSLDEDGFLSVAVGNENGDDVLVQATVLKPRPDMTYEEMGMKVWFWGCLCIKSIERGSIFRNTVLKSTDHIVSINDIVCDKMTSPRQFAHVLTNLPLEVTIVVRRGKQRWNGKFG